MIVAITTENEVLINPSDEVREQLINAFIFHDFSNLVIGNNANATEGTFDNPAIAIGDAVQSVGEGTINIEEGFLVHKAVEQSLLENGVISIDENGLYKATESPESVSIDSEETT